MCLSKKKKRSGKIKKVNRTGHDTALCEYPLEGVYHNRLWYFQGYFQIENILPYNSQQKIDTLQNENGLKLNQRGLKSDKECSP